MSWFGLGKKKTEDVPAVAAPTMDAPPNQPDIAPTNTFGDLPSSNIGSFMSQLPLGTDAAALHPLANLGGSIDYLLLEDASLNNLPGGHTALPSRGFTDDLCYGTGTSYVAALGLGGAWGMMEGLRKTQGVTSTKLKLNGVLNSMTRRGPFLGNTAGVVAVIYNGINSSIGYFRGHHDMANSIVSGALAGAFFKSTAGPRAAGIAAGICAAAAGAWSVGKELVL
ncbi:Mitochondrial import inner membrane translocase subunit tim23 [Saitoella coloradoensis]